jgi:predicted dehydrogenase
MTDQIRLGIIGAGGIVEHRHLPGFSKIDGVSITAVCNRSPESTKQAADKWGIPIRLTDWKKLVHHPEVDAVVVGTWPYLHKEASIETLQAGKPVFCQARMARDASEARAMRGAQRDSGQVAMLCPPPLGMKWDRTMKRLLSEKTIGKVLTIRITSMNGNYLDHDAPLHWRQDPDLSGYNVLTLGIYAEVIRRWFGDHQAVQAISQTHITARPDPETGHEKSVEIPDAVWVHADMGRGTLAQYSLSGLAHCAPTDRVEVYGCHGTILYDLVAEKIYSAQLEDDSLKELPLPDDERRDWEVESDFIRAIRGEKDPEPSFEDGVAYMDVVEGVARSCRSGERIELPLGD